MQVFPTMDIRFPENMEAELIEAMKALCVPPWQWQATNTQGGQPKPGNVFFHRDKTDTDIPCAVCLNLESKGNYAVVAIVPDEMGPIIPHDSLARIVCEFNSLIAEPAAESIKGFTSMDAPIEKLEDHYSAEEIKLLNNFCSSSNAGDGGSNLSDQEKWMDFLICVHRKKTDVHCDSFGELLTPTGWWPERGIPKLVSQYDFGIRLLRQYDK